MGPILSKIKSSHETFETFSLLWLDASVNTSQENIVAQEDLRASINQLKTFENCDECEEYIHFISNDDRIVLIVSGQLGQVIVPRIHSLRQLSSIYVYCHDRQANKQWAQLFQKVKAVVSNLNELITQIQSDHIKRQESQVYESLPISIFDSDLIHQKLTTDLEGNFVHSQLLINTLLRMKSNVTDKTDLVSLCKELYVNNKKELKIIEHFDKRYTPSKAIKWYTKDSFLPRMLNKALRTQNIDVLFLYHFFISDIQYQLNQLRCQILSRVYRSQLMSIDEFRILEKSIGKFISINSFFLTVRDRKQAISCLEDSTDLERVLFVITADPRLDGGKPFANIKSLSNNSDHEILFMLGSIFQIINISQQQDNLRVVQLELCTGTNQQSGSINKDRNLLSFGHVLMTMGKIEEAEIYYRRLLKDFGENHLDSARCYQALGVIADEKGNYNSSLEMFNKSLEINLKQVDTNNSDIATNYNSIGEIYRKQNDYVTALDFHEKALAIWENNDPFKEAVCYNNIGIIYQEQKKYTEALEFYNKAYCIRKEKFPLDQTSLGISYNNIGNVYYFMNHYQEALKYYDQALETYGKSLPPQHPKIASTYNNMGAIHEETGDIKKALLYYENAAKMYRHLFPQTHPNVIKIEENIQRISSQL